MSKNFITQILFIFETRDTFVICLVLVILMISVQCVFHTFAKSSDENRSLLRSCFTN